MLAASARRSRRQNSEEIEADNPTQGLSDAVESDGDARHRRSAKGKKPQTQVSDGEGPEDSADENNDDDERIDVSNFKDQSLPKHNATFLNGLASDWTNCDKVIRQHWSLLSDIGIALVDAAEGDDEPAEIAEVDEIMRELVDISAKFQNNHAILDDLYQKINQGEEISDVMGQYMAGVKERNREYKSKTARQKYAKMDDYVIFRTAVWEALHPDTPMPPLTNFFEKETGDNSDDDDLEVGGQTQDYKCPISLTLLVNPLTSSVCGHSYSGAAIRASFEGRNQGKAIPCPAAGCHQKMTLAQCRPNPELIKKVKAYERRMARQEEYSDAEEVID